MDAYVALALKQIIEVFHDQYGDPYALLPDGQRSCVKLSSKQFERWLSHLISNATGKAVKKDLLSSVIMNLEGHALYRGRECPLDVRIVNHGGAIWYDLGGRAVRIDKSGWAVTSEVPILFRKFGHQQPQVEPVRGGDIKELLEFLNIPKNGSIVTPDQLLFLVWVIFTFIPGYPHPILTLYGPQGSAKTTAFKILKKLIDPSQMDTLSLSDSQREFVQLAYHHYFVPFDNLTHISFDYSDLLCRIVTGDGFSRRALYTNDDDIVFSYRRVLALNGINITAAKADLLDRSLLIGFERVKRFEGERSFWERFEEARPRILGAIFDVLASALAVVDLIPEPAQLRMADFARYGCAIAEAMGFTREEFLLAYETNINEQNNEALSASMIGIAVVRLVEMTFDARWEGTATQLLSDLNLQAGNLGIDVKSRAWPKDPRWVWRRIQEVKTNLERVGIRVQWHDTNSKAIVITKDPEGVPNVGNVEPVAPALDSTELS